MESTFQQRLQVLSSRALRLENYLPGDLERRIEAFVEHYNHVRYHESLNNLTPRPTSLHGVRHAVRATQRMNAALAFFKGCCAWRLRQHEDRGLGKPFSKIVRSYFRLIPRASRSFSALKISSTSDTIMRSSASAFSQSHALFDRADRIPSPNSDYSPWCFAS